MPDLSSLTKEQNDALRDNDRLLAAYRDAVERRMTAERLEAEARHALLQNGYVVAGVQ